MLTNCQGSGVDKVGAVFFVYDDADVGEVVDQVLHQGSAVLALCDEAVVRFAISEQAFWMLLDPDF